MQEIGQPPTGVQVGLATARSLQDAAYRELRRRIVSLEIPAGERLMLENVAADLGVSLTPVRQALGRLESEGFVVSLPNQGARTSPLTAEDLEVIQSIREGIEVRLARLGGAIADEACKRDLRELANLVQSGFADHSRSLPELMDIYWRLVDRLYAEAGRPTLHRFVKQWRSRLVRYLLHFPEYTTDPGILNRMNALVSAVDANDGQRCGELMYESINRTLERLTPLLIAEQEIETREEDR